MTEYQMITLLGLVVVIELAELKIVGNEFKKLKKI